MFSYVTLARRKMTGFEKLGIGCVLAFIALVALGMAAAALATFFPALAHSVADGLKGWGSP
jgi:uncharacterized membrane protein